MQSLHCRRPLGWLSRTCGEAVLAVYSPAQQNSSQRIPLSAETLSETGRVSAPSGLPHTLQVGPGQGSLITLLWQIRSHHILRDLPPLVAGDFPFPHVPKCLPSALSSPLLSPTVLSVHLHFLRTTLICSSTAPPFFPWSQDSHIHLPWS